MITVLLDGEPLRLADGPLPELIKRNHRVYRLDDHQQTPIPHYARVPVLDLGDRR